MKYKNNCGVDSSALDKGYSDTGFIPEDGESVFEAETDENSIFMESSEIKTGGFLKRKNHYDRM
jgi:hypothetical protein